MKEISIPMADIDTIVTLVRDTHTKIDNVNKIVGDLQKNLAETNSKLKGNQELLVQKLESSEKASELQNQILQNQIKTNIENIQSNKKTIEINSEKLDISNEKITENKVRINIMYAITGTIGAALIYILIDKIIGG